MSFNPEENICFIENKGKSEKLADFRIEGSILHVSASCVQQGRKYTSLVLMYKHKAERDRIAYQLPTTIVQQGSKTILSSSFDLCSISFRMSNWQIVAAYEEDGNLYGAPLKAPNNASDIFARYQNDYCCDLGEYIVFPYYSKTGIFNLRYRPRNEYDSQEVHDRELVAYKKSQGLFKSKLFKQNIALIYEKRCTAAQDNGYYLFKYCMENGVNEKGKLKVYYVIDKRTASYDKIKQYDEYVLDFMSLEHMEHLLAAKILISSESRSHAYAWHSKNSIIANCIQEKKHVFLGHGILALKRLNSSFTAKNMGSSLVTVSSAREGQIFKEELGYDDNNISITGYARFDALKDKSSEYREILVMPTHRERLFGVEKDVFMDSEYYKRYMALLNSSRLEEILEREDLRVKFYLHPSIKEHTHLFTSTSDRVDIINYGEIALDELMMRCKFLISDYSSIFWDVLYMKKPALFYQFDIEEYKASWGSYIDIENDLPGDNASNLDELLDNLEKLIANNYQLSNEQLDVMAGFYKYTDRDNCKRIWEEVSKLCNLK